MVVTRHLSFRFAALMAAFAGLVFVTYRQDVAGSLLTPLTTLTAQMTLSLVNWLGMEAVRVGTMISHPDGFAYLIYYRCTGILPVAFLAAAVAAYPARLHQKLAGLAVAVPILIIFNLARLVHLFYLGVHRPAVFDVSHTIVWEILLILVTIGLWVGWTRWCDNRKR